MPPQKLVTDPNDPRWGLPVLETDARDEKLVTDPNDPRWGLPVKGDPDFKSAAPLRQNDRPDPVSFGEFGRRMREQIPTALSGAAAIATGGMSIPAQAAILGATGMGGRMLAGVDTKEAGVGGAIDAMMPPALKGVSLAGRLLEKKVAPVLMQSALKPGLKNTWRAIARGERSPEAATMLRENANVSNAGRERLQDVIEETNQNVTDIVQDIPGTPIRPAAVASHAQPTRAAAANQVMPGSDVSTVNRGVEEFLTENPATTHVVQVGTKQVPNGLLNAQGQPMMTTVPVMGRVARDISATEAQALKQGTYKKLGDKSFGELKSQDIETQKALARGLKEELEKAAEAHSPFLGIKLSAENAREGAAIEAREALARRLATSGNRDIGGIGWLAHDPAAAIGFWLARSPATKSSLANMANQLGRKLPKASQSDLTRLAIIEMLSQQNNPGPR